MNKINFSKFLYLKNIYVIFAVTLFLIPMSIEMRLKVENAKC